MKKTLSIVLVLLMMILPLASYAEAVEEPAEGIEGLSRDALAFPDALHRGLRNHPLLLYRICGITPVTQSGQDINFIDDHKNTS